MSLLQGLTINRLKNVRYLGNTMIDQRKSVIKRHEFSLSKKRPIMICCRSDPFLDKIRSDMLWTIAGPEQQHLFGNDGTLIIPIYMWRESVYIAGKVPRGEAHGESVMSSETLDTHSCCADTFYALQYFALIQALILRSVKTNEEQEAEYRKDSFPIVWPTDSEIDRAGVACLCGYVTDEVLDKFYRGEITDKPYWCEEDFRPFT